YGFGLPADGPKTINRFILDTLEDIPITGTTFRIGDMTIEIVQTLERSVKTARLTMSGGAAAGADGAAAEWAGS
ncbi:MAG: transporter associated domain-containing protein, partial [Gammaproteobacteria bacterium]